MAKNIVFCADGTWNRPGLPDDGDPCSDPTNVFKLFCALAGGHDATQLCMADEQENRCADAGGRVTQVAKYLHGVGDSRNVLVRLLGGSMGAGIIARIVRGYTFVSRNYRPGDRIYLVGFSRGAYTARALAGMIGAMGLLDATKLDLDNRQKAYELGTAVWHAWRRGAIANQGKAGLLGLMSSVVDYLPGFLSRPADAPRVAVDGVEAVGVWDTVGSLGIPMFDLSGEKLDIYRFCDTRLPAKVRRGIHAVALDEQRAEFTPTLWDADKRIVQTLWPGAHADVGGGYPIAANESGLSDGALDWMVGELGGIGVLFDCPSSPFRPRPDAAGVAHKPWRHPPFNAMIKSPRDFRNRPMARSRALVDRLGKPVVAEPGEAKAVYAPANLPPAG